MSSEQIEHEITQLAAQLKTLRLPHKLNQYRVYEKKLLSLKKRAQSATADGDNHQYEAQVDQLQSQLDNSILCGVSQCFICQRDELPFQAPTYNRSVSAGFAYQRTTAKLISQNGSALPKYGQQFSYHGQQTKNPVSTDCQPAQPDIVPSPSPKSMSPSPTPPVKEDEFVSENSPKKCENTADTPDLNTSDEDIVVVNDQLVESNQLNQPVRSPSPIRDIADPSLPPNNIVTPQISSENGNIERERETKPLALPPLVVRQAHKKPPILSPAPFRSSPSSYRAYKDFINNYSTNRTKTSHVEDGKKAA